MSLKLPPDLNRKIIWTILLMPIVLEKAKSSGLIELDKNNVEIIEEQNKYVFVPEYDVSFIKRSWARIFSLLQKPQEMFQLEKKLKELSRKELLEEESSGIGSSRVIDYGEYIAYQCIKIAEFNNVVLPIGPTQEPQKPGLQTK